MNEDTVLLLKECNAGCKSAVNSLQQTEQFVKDESLKSKIRKCAAAHTALGDECHKLLNACNEDEKDPNALGKMFSWLSTEVKLTVDSGTEKIADLMTDGCHMGIKSICRYKNQYPAASEESLRLADRLIRLEEDFMTDMRAYL